MITADVIGSRKQERLSPRVEKGLDELNARHRSHLAAAFTLYRGDEIQGALRSSVDLIRLIRHLRFHLPGLALRIGVGCGEISSGLEKNFAWQMDGSAFHRSRWALEKLQSRRETATLFSGAEQGRWETLNAFYRLIDTVENRWTLKQWQAVDAYERAGTYAAASEELQISPQNVAKRCRAAAWKAVAETERYLAAFLEEGC